jgi:hypothetical protein
VSNGEPAGVKLAFVRLHAIARASSLDVLDKLLLRTILDYAKNETGEGWVSVPRLAEEAGGKDVRTIGRRIVKLRGACTCAIDPATCTAAVWLHVRAGAPHGCRYYRVTPVPGDALPERSSRHGRPAARDPAQGVDRPKSPGAPAGGFSGPSGGGSPEIPRRFDEKPPAPLPGDFRKSPGAPAGGTAPDQRATPKGTAVCAGAAPALPASGPAGIHTPNPGTDRTGESGAEPSDPNAAAILRVLRASPALAPVALPALAVQWAKFVTSARPLPWVVHAIEAVAGLASDAAVARDPWAAGKLRATVRKFIANERGPSTASAAKGAPARRESMLQGMPAGGFNVRPMSLAEAMRAPPRADAVPSTAPAVDTPPPAPRPEPAPAVAVVPLAPERAGPAEHEAQEEQARRARVEARKRRFLGLPPEPAPPGKPSAAWGADLGSARSTTARAARVRGT